MKVLFVENRYTTYLWDAVAKNLIAQGHEVHWVVQNREFIPESGKKHFLDISPRAWTEPKKYDEDIKKAIRSHRGLNYYGVRSDDHVFHARNQICEIIDDIKPDIGFGECTLYHEVLVMQALKARSIPFFFPTACRFPPLRFSFYWYDTLFSFSGSGTKMEHAEASKMVNDIAARTLKPLFLGNALDKPPGLIRKLGNKLKLLNGYLKGERYNTPGIGTRMSLNTETRRVRNAWDSKAVKSVENSKDFLILYPLQLQPESTIDVWATRCNDQSQIIKDILNNTPDNIKIVVKPNPFSFLELNEDILSLIQNEPRIVPLHHSVTMDDLLHHVDLVITTAGTIGMECIFMNKPVVTLVESYFNVAPNCIYIDNCGHLPEIISLVTNGHFPKLTQDEKVDYINYLTSTSYEGFITCTFAQKSALNPSNIKSISQAFLKVLAELNNISGASVKRYVQKKIA